VNVEPVPGSPWSPLTHKVFRSLWIAGLVSAVGSWMHDVGEAWLMTSLSPSPLLVSLLQSAGSLAVFLLALPAGALADARERFRRAPSRSSRPLLNRLRPVEARLGRLSARLSAAVVEA
jgi:hypothetical protein